MGEGRHRAGAHPTLWVSPVSAWKAMPTHLPLEFITGPPLQGDVNGWVGGGWGELTGGRERGARIG